MNLERADHEILSVEVVSSPGGPAEIRRHHTLYGHLRLSVSGPTVAGAAITLNVELVTWDAGTLVTEMDRAVQIMVDDQPVCAGELVGGRAAAEILLPNTGTYSVRAVADRVAEAAILIDVNQ